LRWLTQFDFSQLHLPIAGEQYFPHDLLSLSKDEGFVDGGAFDGDTIRQFLRQTRMEFGEIMAFEPDRANFEKLTQYVLSLDKGSPYTPGRLEVKREGFASMPPSLFSRPLRAKATA
jgi:hypothetical protein